MTGEEWAGIGAVVTAVAGSIALIVKTWRTPTDELEPKALPPGQKVATQAELDALRADMTSLIRTAEEACEDQVTEIRTSADRNAREMLEKVHSLALKVERLLTAHEERHGARSRRGGQR
jgi:hypothetical protein